jgi:protocatechuate 3,4-dioxygenase beta subunit
MLVAMTHEHDLGLGHDLPRFSRRRALGLLATPVVLSACGDAPKTPAGNATTTAIPEETGGPFPGDGSNGPDALTTSGVVRRDITTSFGDASGRAEGVPARITLKLVDVAGGGGPLAGAAIYAWHCDAAGRYSMYDVPDQNYLRGVQECGADGTVVFDTIFPAAYSGRWPHIHFEVYADLDTATQAGSRLRTSQLAIPKDACDAVYKTYGYGGSITNLAQTSLDTDMVFADGHAGQLADWSGSPDSRVDLGLNVGV